MPNFTDYEIRVTTGVTVFACEGGRQVAVETFEVSATGTATTSHSNNQPLRPAIADVVSRAAEKMVPHANAVQANENSRRGVK